jgi:hypothetical protein
MFVYRVHPDGTGLQKVRPEPVILLYSVSPDGRWIVAWAPLPGNRPPLTQAFPLDGGPPVQIGGGILFLGWSLDGRSMLIVRFTGAYLIPLAPGHVFPRIPAGGFHSEEEITRLPGAHTIDVAVPGPSVSVYAFYRNTIQRNLYRIPIP